MFCPGLFPCPALSEGGGAARFSKYIFTMPHINFFQFSEKGDLKVPSVGKKKFSYGKKGMAAAKSYAKKTGKPMK